MTFFHVHLSEHVPVVKVNEKLMFKHRCAAIEGEAKLGQNRFDEQMVRLKKATERINYRSKVLDRLESGLIDLYFEVQDRSAYRDAALMVSKDGFQVTEAEIKGELDGFASIGGTLSTREERESQEKMAFLKEVNNDPIVLLDYLRAILRIQLAFKDEYEGELRGAMESNQAQHEMDLQRREEQIISLKREIKRLSESTALSNTAVENMREESELHSHAHEQAEAKWKEDMYRLQRRVVEKERQIACYEGEKKKMLQIIERMETDLQQIPQLQVHARGVHVC